MNNIQYYTKAIAITNNVCKGLRPIPGSLAIIDIHEVMSLASQMNIQGIFFSLAKSRFHKFLCVT